MIENGGIVGTILNSEEVKGQLNNTSQVTTVANYNELSGKPQINSVELSGNKTLEELGIQPKGEYIEEEQDPTVPSYVKQITEENITKWNNSVAAENLADYALKSEIPDVSEFQTEEEVTALINEAIGGIENGSY